MNNIKNQINKLSKQMKQVINNKIENNVDSLGYNNIFKKELTLEKRLEQSTKIMEKYPNRLPIICDVATTLPKLDKHKYLIPEDLKSESFMYVIRKRIKLEPEFAMYFFVNNNKLLQANRFMSEIYEKYKDDDGFLYVYVCSETTFG
jgi:GABA(A) receptor-associated protein